MNIKIIILGALSFLSFSQAFSTHFIGSNLRYEHVAGDDYKIIATGYYDCSGAATPLPISASQPNISFLLGATNGLNIIAQSTACNATAVNAWGIDSWQEVTQVCPTIATTCEANSPVRGVAQFVLSRTYNFPCTSEYSLFFTSCCMSSDITSGSEDEGLYTSLTFTKTGNSSSISPASYVRVCSGLGGNFDFSATDPDGDSLVYYLDTTYQGSGIPHTYNPGYSPTQPLGTNWNVNLNSNTGILSILPGQFAGLEFTLLTIVTEEYNSGNLVGSTRRMLPVFVVDCGQPSAQPEFIDFSSLSGAVKIDSTTISVCTSVPMSMTMTFQDPDSGETVGLSYVQIQNLPGATITATPGDTATIQLFWTPPSTISYPITFGIEMVDSNCPDPEKKYFNFTIESSSPQAIPTIVEPLCSDSSGSVFLNVVNGLGPYTFQWSNGVTDSFLTNLSPGIQFFEVTDLGCGITFSDSVIITGSGLDISISGLSPDCNLQNGELFPEIIGGTPPFDLYINSFGKSDTITGLPSAGIYPQSGYSEGQYQLIVSDQNNCLAVSSFLLKKADTCTNDISGVVFHDSNGNCQLDATEAGIPNLLVALGDGNYISTDSMGIFSTSLDTGQFVITPVLPSYFFPTCGSDSIVLTFSDFANDTSGLQLSLGANSIQDLSTSVMTNPIIWGQPSQVYAFAKNDGGLPISAAQLTVTYSPSQFSLTGFSFPPAQVDSSLGVITWDILNLLPGQIASIWVSMEQKSTVFIGDSISFESSITLLTGDVTPSNNIDSVNQIVLGSYDPNDKLVTPIGIGDGGFIQPNTPHLDYTIRFQNTGNYPASFVVLRDTLSPYLSLEGFQKRGASHPYSLAIEEDSIMVFTFANINLPDSASDPLGSQGFVVFRLGLYPNLPIGTEIKNSAAIYFDFNPPIFTNTVLNTIDQVRFPDRIDQWSYDRIEVRPNPTKGDSELVFPFDHTWDLTVYDLQGRLVAKKKVHGERSILSSNGLPQGVYVLRVSDKSNTTQFKWVIRR